MGRRSRARRAAGIAPASPTPPPATPRPAPLSDERPKAPWHPFPLVELCVLVGIVLLVLGALDIGSDRGKLMLVLGMALGSLGGLDTALREHLAGYRSHTTVIASLPAVTIAALAYFLGVPWPVVVVAAAAVFAAMFWWMRRVFMRSARRARRARG